MTCLSALLAAFVVIAASLLGGCSDSLVTSGSPPDAAAKVRDADRETHQAAPGGADAAANREVSERLADAALDDGGLSEIRGGFELGSGVVLNFAFQQATFVNHNLTESVVVPTLTISPGQGTVSVAGGTPISAATRPVLSAGSLNSLGIPGPPAIPGGGGISSATVVANGSIQTQVNVSVPTLQNLVNSGLASVIGTGSGTGNGGVTSVIANTANNQLIQQMTTVDIGVSGLSKLIQQSVPSTVLTRLTGPNAFR